MTQTLYRYFSGDTLLYIGVSVNAYYRAQQHQQNAAWWEDATHVTFEKFDTREAVEEAETRAIRSEKPKYNVVKTRFSRIPGSPHPKITAMQEASRLWMDRNTKEFFDDPDPWLRGVTLDSMPQELFNRLVSMRAAMDDVEPRSYADWCVLIRQAESLQADWMQWWSESH